MRASSLARFSTARLRPQPNIAPLPAMSARYEFITASDQRAGSFVQDAAGKCRFSNLVADCLYNYGTLIGCTLC
jgi:hypothetical protein